MFARPPLATLHALAALAIVSLSTGCTVVGLQVQNLSARQGEARNLAAHNGNDRAAALLRAASPAAAFSLATRAWERRHSPEAAQLAFLAALTTGDFQSATGWHARSQTPS